ncbi:hypothetical protein OG920_24740 [Streptomyces europaeiscabiei]|uniref:hypothetical protein n=1 Tax=Streptomyces europaeiscabiei TaxID=146819 RepID=UPI002E190DE4
MTKGKEEFDETFVRLFQNATPSAAAVVADRMEAQGRLYLLNQRRYPPPEGLRDWIAKHGDADEVEALYENWGLTARQAALVVTRADLIAGLDSDFVEVLGDGGSAVSSKLVEQQWRTTPAGHFRMPGQPWSTSPLPEVEERVRARLGSDVRAWETAFVLLARGFPGDLPDLLDHAARHDASVAASRTHVDPKNVSWLGLIAPGDLPERLLARLGPGMLAGADSDLRARLASLLIASGNPAVWESILGRRDDSMSHGSSGGADIERAFLRLDVPRINEWLLIGATDAQRRLPPATRLALLEGRPFGSTSEPSLPRTYAVQARLSFPASEPWDTDLLRLCYDSREPGLVAHALHASWQGDEEVLTPYQQLVAGIRLWESDHVHDLRALTSQSTTGIRDRDVRDVCAESLRIRSVRPLQAAAEERRRHRDEHLDEALRTWWLRLSCPPQPHDLLQLTQSEVAAAGRTITGDPWYQVDWDLVRSRLSSPRASDHRDLTLARYRILLAHDDCPEDVARSLADADLTPLDLQHVLANRDTAIDTLASRCIVPWTPASGGMEPQALVNAASAQPGWVPGVTVEDVVRHARPVRSIVRAVGNEHIGRIVAQVLDETRAAQPGVDEADVWTHLSRITPYSMAPLPRLVRHAVELAVGAETVDVLPAADFLVGPDLDDASAKKVREHLSVLPAHWAKAVRLLANGFEGPLAALLDAATREEQQTPSAEPASMLVEHHAAAVLLGLAPGAVIDSAVARLDVPVRLLLARTTYSAETLQALVRHGDRQLWDILLNPRRLFWPLTGSEGRLGWGHLRDETLVPALLAQDDPWLNARLVRELFHGSTALRSHMRAVLSGTPFGPRDDVVTIHPDLLADFADWTPESGRELPAWTRGEHFWDFPQPVLALQAMMAVRQRNYQDAAETQLSTRQSLVAAATIAAAGRFDLLQYVVDRWRVRYPWLDHKDERKLYEEAIRLRSAGPIEERLAEMS